MLTFAARPKSSVFGSHSPADNGISSPIMGQGGGGGGASRLKRLSWMLNPSRSAQGLASDASQPKKSTNLSTNESTSRAPRDARPVPSSIQKKKGVRLSSITIPNATTDTARPMAVPNNKISTDTEADADVDVVADTSTSGDVVPDSNAQLFETVPLSKATSVATSASTSSPSDPSVCASEENSPTGARKSSISFPIDLPKPEHPPSINQTPIDALSESSFGRKSSVSSVSFRRSRNPSVAPSLHKQASNSLRNRTASPPPQR
ncbi:hypothetical protein E4U41_001462 [Claviceps citrina]|nr:hypothetical protein E4U41_001462 [Claviceps citrina]